MTDYDALVERLRSMARAEHDDLSIGDEAADAIRDLRAERDGLREALTRAAENLKLAAKDHSCLACREGEWLARAALKGKV